jgi:very-short-patch-repair endonuclease
LAQEAPISAVHRDRRAIARLAARQHGVVAARQLRRLGLDWGAIKYRVRTAELHRIHDGVYAVGHPALEQHGKWMAAVLAGGEGAAVSHRHAAALAGFRETIAAEIDVITPTHRGRRDGIIFHEAQLHPADLTEVDDIPVTAVPRTLLDLAGEFSPGAFEVAFWEAERLDMIDPHELRAFLARSHGRRGMAQLRRLADRMLTKGIVLHSPLERRFHELIRDTDLPLPAFNHWVEGMKVDAVWLERRLVVELDGAAFHRGVGAALRDAERDARLEKAGYRVLRVSYGRLTSEPGAVMTELRRALTR